MKKCWERTKEERNRDQKIRQLESLRSQLLRKYWTASEAALYLIGVNSIENYSEKQGYLLSFLPGRVDADWRSADGTRNQSHFDEHFECIRKDAKNALAMVSVKAADTPKNWILSYLESGETIPWFNIAKNDNQCAKLLSYAKGDVPPKKSGNVSGTISPHEKGGHEKARGSVSSFVRVEIEKQLKRWHREPHLYSDCGSFKRDMKRIYINPQAPPDPEEFPDKSEVSIRSPKTITRHVNDLLAIHNMPTRILK